MMRYVVHSNFFNLKFTSFTHITVQQKTQLTCTLFGKHKVLKFYSSRMKCCEFIYDVSVIMKSNYEN